MSKLTKLSALVLVAVSGIACGDSPTNPGIEVLAPSFAVTTNTDVPLGAIFNPCNGDIITFASGRLHILLSTTIDANGGFHATLRFQPKDAH